MQKLESLFYLQGSNLYICNKPIIENVKLDISLKPIRHKLLIIIDKDNIDYFTNTQNIYYFMILMLYAIFKFQFIQILTVYYYTLSYHRLKKKTN